MLLRLNNFNLPAKIGVFSWEKVIVQRIIVDLEVELEQRIDYCLIADYIKEFTIQQHYEFIEELAELLSSALNKRFCFKACKLRVTKPGCIQNSEGVSIYQEKNNL